MIQSDQFFNQNGLLVTPWTTADQTAVVCLVAGGVPLLLWLRLQARAWDRMKLVTGSPLQIAIVGNWVLAAAMFAAAVISVVVPPEMPDGDMWHPWQGPMLHPVIGYLVSAVTLTVLNAILLRMFSRPGKLTDSSLSS